MLNRFQVDQLMLANIKAKVICQKLPQFNWNFTRAKPQELYLCDSEENSRMYFFWLTDIDKLRLGPEFLTLAKVNFSKVRLTSHKVWGNEIFLSIVFFVFNKSIKSMWGDNITKITRTNSILYTDCRICVTFIERFVHFLHLGLCLRNLCPCFQSVACLTNSSSHTSLK